MVMQVLDSGGKYFDRVTGHAEHPVAGVAEQAAHFTCRMVVINREPVDPIAPVAPGSDPFRFMANGTHPLLCDEHRFIGVKGDVEGSHPAKAAFARDATGHFVAKIGPTQVSNIFASLIVGPTAHLATASFINARRDLIVTTATKTAFHA